MDAGLFVPCSHSGNLCVAGHPWIGLAIMLMGCGLVGVFCWWYGR